MLFYKNNSTVTKTFYGVVFRPGEIKQSPGYINSSNFIRVFSMPKEPPKRIDHVKKQVNKPVKPKPVVNDVETIVQQGGTLDGADSNQ